MKSSWSVPQEIINSVKAVSRASLLHHQLTPPSSSIFSCHSLWATTSSSPGSSAKATLLLFYSGSCPQGYPVSSGHYRVLVWAPLPWPRLAATQWTAGLMFHRKCVGESAPGLSQRDPQQRCLSPWCLSSCCHNHWLWRSLNKSQQGKNHLSSPTLRLSCQVWLITTEFSFLQEDLYFRGPSSVCVLVSYNRNGRWQTYKTF